jgi:hypothetical protein
MLKQKHVLYLIFNNHKQERFKLEAFNIYDFEQTVDMSIQFQSRIQMEVILKIWTDELEERGVVLAKLESEETPNILYGEVYIYHTQGNRGKIHIKKY